MHKEHAYLGSHNKFTAVAWRNVNKLVLPRPNLAFFFQKLQYTNFVNKSLHSTVLEQI